MPYKIRDILFYTILWAMVLIFAICTMQPIVVIVCDALCAVLWIVCLIVHIIKFKKNPEKYRALDEWRWRNS